MGNHLYTFPMFLSFNFWSFTILEPDSQYGMIIWSFPRILNESDRCTNRPFIGRTGKGYDGMVVRSNRNFLWAYYRGATYQSSRLAKRHISISRWWILSLFWWCRNSVDMVSLLGVVSEGERLLVDFGFVMKPFTLRQSSKRLPYSPPPLCRPLRSIFWHPNSLPMLVSYVILIEVLSSTIKKFHLMNTSFIFFRVCGKWKNLNKIWWKYRVRDTIRLRRLFFKKSSRCQNVFPFWVTLLD